MQGTLVELFLIGLALSARCQPDSLATTTIIAPLTCADNQQQCLKEMGSYSSSIPIANSSNFFFCFPQTNINGNCPLSCPPICARDEIFCPGILKTSGCFSPAICKPLMDPVTGCPNYCAPDCPSGQRMCPGIRKNCCGPSGDFCCNSAPFCTTIYSCLLYTSPSPRD